MVNSLIGSGFNGTSSAPALSTPINSLISSRVKSPEICPLSLMRSLSVGAEKTSPSRMIAR